MHGSSLKIDRPLPVIRQLDEAAINRIAAGEVVERPAAALKELMENAIDAQASKVSVTISDGGKTLIRVVDDGVGMRPQDLPLALSRHATSKIDGSDLLDIRSFGFRGEALPSLGAVGRLDITSRAQGFDGHAISVAAGVMSAVRPAALREGTIVELRDLFYATPARLKFMRSDRAETQAILDTMRRLAMAEPFVQFELLDHSDKPRKLLSYPAQSGDPVSALRGRLRDVLGPAFIENAVALDAQRDGFHLTGFAALPTYSRGSAVTQYLFVNGRTVRDKLLVGALRAAYMDFLSRDRHAAAALFIDCDPVLVDVNVHPAKTEVRFRDPGAVRGLIVTGLRHALAGEGHRAASTVSDAALGAFQPEPSAPRVYQMVQPPRAPRAFEFAEAAAQFSGHVVDPEPAEPDALPLGVARGQVHENYIIAQTQDGVVIVDQHAAHERLVYEKLKQQMAENGVASQTLLIPEVIELPAGDAERLLAVAEDLNQLGLALESFGPNTVVVRATPAVLGQVDAAAMVHDILDELAAHGSSTGLKSRIDAILSRVACHGSIRSGRRMRADEMNALLRDMEATPHSGQCNHGRPTYVELKLKDIERLFERS